jgi:hypothetical protein
MSNLRVDIKEVNNFDQDINREIALYQTSLT